MHVAMTAPTTMAATTNPLARLGVGVAMVPAAMTAAAHRARSVFLIESSISMLFCSAVSQCGTLMKIKALS